METKKCSRCKCAKPLSDFTLRSNRPSGRMSHCKECHALAERKAREINPNRKFRCREATIRWVNNQREYYRTHDLKKKYGMTLDEYEQMAKSQGGRCYICGKKPKTRRLAVDHSHKDGHNRKLLCTNCNTALGMIDDSLFIAESMARYIRETKTEWSARQMKLSLNECGHSENSL